MLSSCGHTVRPSKLLWMTGKPGKSGYICLGKSLESPGSRDCCIAKRKSTWFCWQHEDIRVSNGKSKSKLNAQQSKKRAKWKKQYTWRMPSWNEIVCRSLPWFPGEWSRSPCKSFGILFWSNGSVLCRICCWTMCAGDTTLMATAFWYEQEKVLMIKQSGWMISVE